MIGSASESKFKLVISEKLEGKIRFLCEKYPETEWSGILFYKYISGNIDNGDLKLKGMDFYLLDVGTKCYTEFSPTPDVTGYQIDNDLLDCFWGLQHSHNSFSCFFSSTDESTLNKIGETMNHCLSLIVNNEGKYNARITRILNRNIDADVKCTYNSFENQQLDFEYKSEGNDSVVQYIESNIEIIHPIDNISEEDKNVLEERIETIEAEKKAKEVERKNVSEYYSRNWRQLDLFDDYSSYYMNSTSDNADDNIEYNIKKFIYVIITGDMFPNTEMIKQMSMKYIVKKAIDISNKRIDDINEWIYCDEQLTEYIYGILSFCDVGLDADTSDKIMEILKENSYTNDWVGILYDNFEAIILNEEL